MFHIVGLYSIFNKDKRYSINRDCIEVDNFRFNFTRTDQRAFSCGFNFLFMYNIILSNLENGELLNINAKDLLGRSDIIGFYEDMKDAQCTIILYNSYEAIAHMQLIDYSNNVIVHTISSKQYSDLLITDTDNLYTFFKFMPACKHCFLGRRKGKRKSSPPETISVIDLLLEGVKYTFKDDKIYFTLRDQNTNNLMLVSYCVKDKAILDANIGKASLLEG